MQCFIWMCWVLEAWLPHLLLQGSSRRVQQLIYSWPKMILLYRERSSSRTECPAWGGMHKAGWGKKGTAARLPRLAEWALAISGVTNIAARSPSCLAHQFYSWTRNKSNLFILGIIRDYLVPKTYLYLMPVNISNKKIERKWSEIYTSCMGLIF